MACGQVTWCWKVAMYLTFASKEENWMGDEEIVEPELLNPISLK